MAVMRAAVYILPVTIIIITIEYNNPYHIVVTVHRVTADEETARAMDIQLVYLSNRADLCVHK